MAFKRNKSPLRWLMLTLACVAMFGPYYVYDNPAALQNSLEQDMDISPAEFNWFYSIYSVPNVILPFFGGTMVDKWGTKLTMFLFLSFICLGQCIFALGVSEDKYWLALLGRGVFGIGGESMSVASSALLALWFRGKELALAMGINIAVSRLGSVANDQVSVAIEKDKSISLALWFGFLLTLVSLGCTVLLIVVENYAERQAAEEEEKKRLLAEPGTPGTPGTPFTNSREYESMDIPKKEAPETVNCTDVGNFQLSYWLICASCVIVYTTVIPYNNIAGGMIADKYNWTSSQANVLLAVPYAVSAALSPFLGGAVDKFGNRARLLTVSAMSLFGAHFLMGFTMLTPWVPQITIGVSYSVYAAAVWPSVAYVVKEEHLGTAYGVITSIQNGGLLLGPIIVGQIQGKTCVAIDPYTNKKADHCYCSKECYRTVEGFFCIVALIGILIGVWLNIEDAKQGDNLNRVHTGEDAKTEVVFDADMATPKIDHHSKKMTNVASAGSTPVQHSSRATGQGRKAYSVVSDGYAEDV